MTADSVAFVGLCSDRYAETVRLFRDIQHADGVSWQHFRCPDGTVAEIIGPGQAPARP